MREKRRGKARGARARRVLFLVERIFEGVLRGVGKMK
jgi:hypothetical protein